MGLATKKTAKRAVLKGMLLTVYFVEPLSQAKLIATEHHNQLEFLRKITGPRTTTDLAALQAVEKSKVCTATDWRHGVTITCCLITYYFFSVHL